MKLTAETNQTFSLQNYLQLTGIPTNTSRGFHVETTWKRSFPRRFNVESAWCVCWDVLKDTLMEITPLNKTLALRKSTTKDVWAVGTSNQLFTRGF